jgi:CPA1 family monovalent cation:H+ antiporter
VWIGLAAAAVAVVLRMMFVAPLVGVLRRDAARAVSARPELEKMQSRVADPELLGRFSARRVEHIGQRITRLLADVDFLVAEGFGWRGGVVLAWSGMRGVVTVAAAQSLPDDTPYRPQLVLIAFVVAATTLLVQGLTLPRVIRALKISGDDATADRAEYRELITDLTETARAVLDDPDLCLPDGSPYPAAVLDRARQDALVPPAVPDAEGDADDSNPREQYRQLMLQLLAAERAQLLAARSAGTYTSRTLTRAQRAMDLLEATLQQIPDLTEPG